VNQWNNGDKLVPCDLPQPLLTDREFTKPTEDMLAPAVAAAAQVDRNTPSISNNANRNQNRTEHQ
jgi:hypothetical protein